MYAFCESLARTLPDGWQTVSGSLRGPCATAPWTAYLGVQGGGAALSVASRQRCGDLLRAEVPMRDRDGLLLIAAGGLGLVGGLVGRSISMRSERRRLDAFEDEIDQVSRRLSSREGRAGQEKRRRMRGHEDELEELAQQHQAQPPPPNASPLQQLQALARNAWPSSRKGEV
jgi:hypothetical protein